MTSVIRGPRTWWMGSARRTSDVIVSVASRLRQTRKALGISQRDAAAFARVSETRWSNWERGDHLLDVETVIIFNP